MPKPPPKGAPSADALAVQLVEVALPVPVHANFTYLPGSLDVNSLLPGTRVQVPFGSRRLIGVVTAVVNQTPPSDYHLKAIIDQIDQAAVINPFLFKLAHWISQYYLQSLGEVLAAMLPGLGETDLFSTPKSALSGFWSLTEHDKTPKQAHRRQYAVWQALSELGYLHDDALTSHSINRAALKALELKNWVKWSPNPPTPSVEHSQAEDKSKKTQSQRATAHTSNQVSDFELSHAQQSALLSINSCSGYGAFLLFGVTGSGKTQVYIEAIKHQLLLGKQVLVLLPEINLTPQTLARFQSAFAELTIQLIHSRMSATQRAQSYRACLSGDAQLVLGTRSAVFAPLSRLGLILIDESHDSSYKQQSGVRYHARDVALMRATQHQCAVVLGSATPSIDTLKLVDDGKITRLDLPNRAGQAKPPTLSLLDTRGQFCPGGISPDALSAIHDTLKAGNQALVFLNRRGFAQVMLCLSCGWQAHCQRCEVAFTVHQSPANQLCCHHCGWQQRPPKNCPECGSANLSAQGIGTQQLEQQLMQTLPGFDVLRVDSDSTRKKQSFSKLLERIHQGDPLVMIGTQMLAKGHHFEKLTLVVVLGSDQSLFSADFRAAERSAQLITQVAGRAGRGPVPGRVLIQTLKPDHPLLLTLTQHGYEALAQQLKTERQQLSLPPYAYSALVIARGSELDHVLQTLSRAQASINQQIGRAQSPLEFWGPSPAPVPRKNGRYGGFLWVLSHSRRTLNETLSTVRPKLEELSKRVHITIDVDPIGFD